MILCLLTNYIGFSQTIDSSTNLKPDTILVDSNGAITHFAWRTSDQVPILAQHVVKSNYSDTLQVLTESLTSGCQAIILEQANVINLQDILLQNRAEMLNLDSSIIRNQKKQLRSQKREIIKYKITTTASIVLAVVVIGVFVTRTKN